MKDLIRTEVTHHNKNYVIEYEKSPISYKDAWRPCGDGVWVYDDVDKELHRNRIGFSHELPYNYYENTWNPKGRFHKVVASDKPLWVWWGEGCDKLKWGDIGVALPKLILHVDELNQTPQLITVNNNYSCIDCDWEGNITECDFDTEYDEFKDIDRKYPISPKCGGGLNN